MSDYEVIQAIYPDYLANDGDLLLLTVPVELTCTVAIAADQLRLTSLPPLVLTLSLPTILDIRSTHDWLADPHLRALQHNLSSEPALYSSIEAIRTGAFLSDLGLLHESTLTLPHATPALIPLLAAHASSQIKSSFQIASHRCDICLSHYKGAKCVQLHPCAHVFCKQCLADFWGMCVREGDVARVVCPTPDCHHPAVSDDDLASVLSNEQIHRLRWLSEKKAYESDPSIILCPIQSCQSPVPKPPESSNAWDKLRQCPKCSFSFCAFCRRTWHGPVEPCSLASTNLASLISSYLSLCSHPSSLSPDDLARKSRLERQYGYKTLQRLVKKQQEEQANQAYLKDNATKCPGKACSAWVQKNLGCNHITCTQCKSHFCYRCGSTLDPGKIYTHFSTPGSCLNKLFDSDSSVEEWEWEDDEDDDEVGG